MSEIETVIVPPTIQAMMSGAVLCRRGPSATTLVYEDGSEERVLNKAIPATVDWENWFSIVGGIQSLRRADKA